LEEKTMGVNRIVRRNLKRSGDVSHTRIITGKHDENGYSIDMQRSHMKCTDGTDWIRVFHPTWVDLRSRDKYGILSGHCSEMAKRVVRISGRKVVGISSGAVGIHI
jgi:hypothetical protein